MKPIHFLLPVFLAGLATGYLLFKADPEPAQLAATKPAAQPATQAADSPAQIPPPRPAENVTTMPSQPESGGSARPDTGPEPASQPGPDSIMETMQLSGDFAQTEALYVMAGRADRETLERYIDEAIGIDIPAEREAALQILYLRYSELDPDASLTHLLALDISRKVNILYVMFNGWAKYDLDGAIERAARIESSNDQGIVQQAIMQAYETEPGEVMLQIAERLNDSMARSAVAVRGIATTARSDPAAAMRHAMSLTSARNQAEAVVMIGRIWGETDPQGALAYSSQLNNPRLAREFRMAALGTMLQKDPESGFDLLDGSFSQEQQMILGMSVSVMAQADPEQALRRALTVENPQLRQSALSTTVSTWANTDPMAAAAALESMQDLTPDQRRNMAYGVLHHMAQADPQEALAWAERMDNGQDGLWSSAVNTIASQNPEEALAVVLAMDHSRRRTDALSNVLGNIALSDPLLATEYLDEIPAGELREQAFTNIASNWGNNDPVAAMEWLLQQDNVSQSWAYQNLAQQIAHMDLQLANDYIEQIPEAGRGAYVGMIAMVYAQRDPAAGARWVMRFEDSPNFGTLVGQIAAGLAKSDPRRAARLMDEVPEGEQYVMAQQTLISQWADFDPAAAARWWGQLPAQKQLDHSVRQLVYPWARFDREAAQKWVLGLKMSEQRDQGIAALVDNNLELREADKLIRKIQSLDLRMQAYQNLAFNLSRYDRDDAEDMIGRARLPDEYKQQLRQVLGQAYPRH